MSDSVQRPKINERLAMSVLASWRRADGTEPRNASYEQWDKHLAAIRDEGGFHWTNGIYFKRLTNGIVRVTHFYDWNYCPNYSCWDIPASEWASIVSAVSGTGENWESYNNAVTLHGVHSKETESQPAVPSSTQPQDLLLSERMRNWDKHNQPSGASNYADEVADLERRNAELLAALSIYADHKNWSCTRCKGHDHLNCRLTRYDGPLGKEENEMCGEAHGYSIAEQAIAARGKES